MLNHVEVVSFLHYCITTSKKSDALGVNTEALQSSGKRAEQRRADVLNSPGVNFQIRLKAQITVQPMIKLGVRTMGVLFLFKPIH